MPEHTPEHKLPFKKPGIVKLVFGHLWAFWGLIVFVSTMLVVLVPILVTFLIPDPRVYTQPNRGVLEKDFLAMVLFGPGKKGVSKGTSISELWLLVTT